MLIKGFGKIDENEIIQLENKVHCKLPEDYKTFLMNNNGGNTDEEIVCFNAENVETEIVLDILLGTNLSESGLCIEKWYEEYKKELPEEMIIIGHAMESGMILLVNQADWKGIYFWDSARYRV